MEISEQCIPNKTIRVRTSDSPWKTSTLKKYIRIRKRFYRKTKQTNDPDLWNDKFRRYRNKTLSLISKSKQSHTDKLNEKLHSDQLSSKDWWATLKYFISPTKPSSISPLNSKDIIVNDATEKANLLNNFF